MKSKRKDIISNIILIIYFTWLVLCVIDVNAHNMTDQNFASWNIFNFNLWGK